MASDLLGYLRDAAQGASNSVASNVSGPVDLLAWLLRKGGVPVPENALGGSQWMAEQGLTAKPKNALAGMAGETLGMIGPMLAVAKAPQIANALNRVAENAAMRPMLNPQTGAIVWHGSPHKFDAFDSSKIGTGEGAQAYGHGLYLADSPDVAKTYVGRGQVVGGDRVEAQLVKRLEAATDAGRYGEAMALEDLLVNFSPAKAASKFTVENGYTAARVAEAQRVIKELGPKFKETGLYKVDLPDEQIAKMLDWDKPLSQQSEFVRKALEPLGYRADPQALSAFDDALAAALSDAGPGAALPKMPANPMGSDIARGSGIFDGAGQVVKADRLRKAGIPGIRYLDGGSRGAGAGTSNYVVFPGEENALRILERNGVPIGR